MKKKLLRKPYPPEHNASICPTPYKRAFLKERAALMAKRASKQYGMAMHAYECICGRYHLTKQPRRD